MKRLIFSLACVVLMGSTAVAQELAGSTPSTTSQPTRTPDQLIRYYDSKLSLTDDQKAKLKPIIADRQQKMMDLRSDTSRPMIRARKMKALTEEEDMKIKAVLTGDQWTKYQAMEAEAKEKMKEKRAGR